MKRDLVYTSLCRISDLETRPFRVEPLGHSAWEMADYIALRIRHRGHGGVRLELTNGRMMEPLSGLKVIGALGDRHATLEITGAWKLARPDQPFHLLTGAGLAGRMTSFSPFSPFPMEVEYLGHLTRQSRKVTMHQFLPTTGSDPYAGPVILIVGTSMSAGKTTVSRIVINELVKMGKKVLGVKMTGAGRYRDILTMADAGADVICDFVDVGLPSTAVDPDLFRERLALMLRVMADKHPDVAVVEIGASPMEPYRGDLAMEALGRQIRATLLCASDPYAALGVQQAFGLRPDIIAGPATNTIAGAELAQRLCGVPAINIILPEHLPILDQLLVERCDHSDAA